MQGHQVGTTMMKGRFLGLLTLLLCFESGIAASPNTGKNYAGDSNTLPGPPPPQHHSGGSEPVRQPSSVGDDRTNGLGGDLQAVNQRKTTYSQGRGGTNRVKERLSFGFPSNDRKSETVGSEPYNAGTGNTNVQYHSGGSEPVHQPYESQEPKFCTCMVCTICKGCTVHGENDVLYCKIIEQPETLDTVCTDAPVSYSQAGNSNQQTLIQTPTKQKNKVCHCKRKKWITGLAGLGLAAGGGVSVFSYLDIIKTTGAASDAVLFSLLAVAGISFMVLVWMCCRNKHVATAGFTKFVSAVSIGILGVGSIVAIDIAMKQASAESVKIPDGLNIGMAGAIIVSVVCLFAACCYYKSAKSICCSAPAEFNVGV